MLIIGITVALMVVAATSVWLAARRWTAFQLAPRVKPEHIRAEVRRHPRAAALASSRLDPSSATGLALTAALFVLVVGIVALGLLVWMIRSNVGFARFDLGAARFAAAHASPASTRLLRDLSVLGGAVFLGPCAGLMCLAVVRRDRLLAVVGFLLLTVGGQFAVVDLIKWIVDRSRPDIDRLTNFSGPSFPSGHAAASAASFAAFALLLGMGRAPRFRATLAAVAVALAVGIAASRVFLGVHWFTDVLAGLAFGWAWFALCSIAFGGRLLHFGAPAEEAEQAVESDQQLSQTAWRRSGWIFLGPGLTATLSPIYPCGGREGYLVYFPRNGVKALERPWPRRSRKEPIMGVATSIVVFAVGAILKFATTVHSSNFNIQTIGVILMVVGVVGFIVSIIFWASWGGFGGRSRSRRVYQQPGGTVVEERHDSVG